jgi:hypothetical protein
VNALLVVRCRTGIAAVLEHDPEKWEPVFGKDHAPMEDLEFAKVPDQRSSAPPRFALRRTGARESRRPAKFRIQIAARFG